MFKNLVEKNRSYRRFAQNHEISRSTLLSLLEHARLCPSAANMQPLRYMIYNTSKENELIFPCLNWAAYLNNWDGPAEQEKPSAYIIILGNSAVAQFLHFDTGIVAQTILLAATELGLGGCMIASVRKNELKEILQLPDELEIILVLALGKPQETVIIETVSENSDIKYWRDSDSVHHVPKRKLEDLLLN